MFQFFTMIAFVVIPTFVIGQHCRFDDSYVPTEESVGPTDHICINNVNVDNIQNPFYFPDDTDPLSLDLKIIRIKFIVAQFSDSDPQNFVEGNADHDDFLQGAIDRINNNLLNVINCPVYNSNGSCVCDEAYCTTIGGAEDCCISDSKLRIKLEPTEYIQDPLAWGCSGGEGFLPGCNGDPYCRYMLNHHLSEEECILNVFLFEPGGAGPIGNRYGGCGVGFFGEATNIVMMDNIFEYYNLGSGSLSDKKQILGVLLHLKHQ